MTSDLSSRLAVVGVVERRGLRVPNNRPCTSGAGNHCRGDKNAGGTNLRHWSVCLS